MCDCEDELDRFALEGGEMEPQKGGAQTQLAPSKKQKRTDCRPNVRQPFCSGSEERLPLAFLRVVEVIPPQFPISPKRGPISASHAMERLVNDVRRIKGLADVILVANVKDQGQIKMDSVQVAAELQERLSVESAPVIAVRDLNRLQFLSAVLTSTSLGLKSAMVVWGDDYPASSNVTNVRDFSGLARAVQEASLIRSRARAPTRLFAPVDVDLLARPRGVALARGRLRAGADILLAQPPTTDAEAALRRHTSLVESAGLKGKVLFNVFPFKDRSDVAHYEAEFGWRLPHGIYEAAGQGEKHVLDLEREVVERLRRGGYPGVYVSTRGSPEVAVKLLS